MPQPANVQSYWAAQSNMRDIVITDNGTISGTNIQIQGGVSATAPATPGAGTIATAGLRVSRVTPAAAITGVILAVGTVDGQEITIQNEGAAGSNINFATDATSNVSNGLSVFINSGEAMRFVWGATATRWFAIKNPQREISGSALTPGDGAVIDPTGLYIVRANPGAAHTGIIITVGTYVQQEFILVNEAAAANTLTMAAVATSHVADGVSSVVAGLTAARFVWENSLWYHVK